MIYDYIITKPELNDDLLVHYGIQAKDHKYISRKKGPNGKWIYTYDNTRQKSAYDDRREQIKDSRDKTSKAYAHRWYESRERRKYAYTDRASQIRRSREKTSREYAMKKYNISNPQQKVLASRIPGSTYSENKQGHRLMDAKVNAKRRARAKTLVNATTKGYGKGSTQPSTKALTERSAKATAAARARKNRRSK